MKASELRIGNFVQDKKYKRAWRINHFLGVQVVEVDHWMFEYETDDCHEPNIYDLEPIPLTEEWFERFGFEWNHSRTAMIISFGTSKKIVWESKIPKKVYVAIGREMEQVNTNGVHKLQNLYFALSGEELTLK